MTSFVIDAKGADVDHPNIGISGINRGILDYKTLVTEDIPRQISREEESYEEALNDL